MKETLEVINRMEADGVIGKYAIGGAVGASFYLEPIATVDVDIFVELPLTQSSLVTVGPIYDYLSKAGARIENEYVVVGEWPVQFLPVANELQREALQQARDIDVDGTATRILLSEHLVAIALETGRLKDQTRILQFLSEKMVDLSRLMDLFKRHGLLQKWQAFEQRFLK
jgi:hypothetical protein